MKYNCTLCNYLSDDRKNFSHHKKTKKHQENVSKQPNISKMFPQISNDFQTENNNTEDQNILYSDEKSNEECKYKCSECNIYFKTNSGLYKHNKTCKNKQIEQIKNSCEKEIILKEKELIQKQLEEVKKEKEELKLEKEKQLEEIKKEKEELKKEKEEEKKKLEEQLLYYRDVAYNKKDNDSNMTNLNFINTHYADAPVLEGPKDLHRLFLADKSGNPDVYYAKLAQELGSHHRLNILHVVIADFIVKEYCKEDKTKQSVWNSDSSRLNYIIKECIQKDKIWIMDKSGQSLLKKVIKPIIEYIKPELEEATKRVISYSNKPNGITFLDMKDHQALLEIGNNIMNKSLEEDILKELTKHFNINQKLLLKDIKAKNKELVNKIDIKTIKDIEDVNNIDKKTILAKEDSLIKLKKIVKEIDTKLEKLRKEERKLDLCNDTEDKSGKYKNIEDTKKELKKQKKEINKSIINYEELIKKINEAEKEQNEISNDTESEDEQEKERLMKINRISRKMKELTNNKINLENEINEILKQVNSN